MAVDPCRAYLLKVASRLSATAVCLLTCTAMLMSACGSTAATPAAPVEASAIAASGTTFGEPTGLWEIPREVQWAYAKAVCLAPESEFGFDGSFDDATGNCATGNDMTSDVQFLMRNLLSKDANQMSQATRQMLDQSGAEVPECAGSDPSTVTNDCVIAAMQALVSHLSK